MILILIISSIFAGEFDAQIEECQLDTAKEWSNNLNRCMTKSEVKTQGLSYKNCTELTSKEERDLCFWKEVEKHSKKGANVEDYNPLKDQAFNLITGAVQGSNLVWSGGSESNCMSLKVAAGCSLATMAKEIFVMQKAKKIISDSKAQYLKLVKASEDSDYDSQLLAYDTQIEHLKNMASFYEYRANLFKLSGACFTGASLFAGNDLWLGNNKCLSGEGASEDVDFKNAFMGNATGLKWLYKQISTPIGVMIGSLTHAGLSLSMANKSQDSGEYYEDMANKLTVVRKQFEDSVGKQCQTRDDISNLDCYCYISDGVKNPNRTNSQKCQNLWAQNDRNLWVASEDKTRLTSSGEKKGCVDTNGNYDANCDCRDFKDENGINACKKLSFSTASLGAIGTQLDVAQLESQLNSLFEGAVAASGLELTQAQSNALSEKTRAKILSMPKAVTKNDALPDLTSQDIEDFSKSLLSKGMQSYVDSARKSMAGLSNQEESLTKVKNEKESLKKVVGLKFKDSKKASTSISKKPSLAYSSGLGSEKALFYKKKKYKLGNADIVTRKDQSIWNVISNRYNKSAYSRLFE